LVPPARGNYHWINRDPTLEIKSFPPPWFLHKFCQWFVFRVSAENLDIFVVEEKVQFYGFALQLVDETIHSKEIIFLVSGKKLLGNLTCHFDHQWKCINTLYYVKNYHNKQQMYNIASLYKITAVL
jgi:hypothetical protein